MRINDLPRQVPRMGILTHEIQVLDSAKRRGDNSNQFPWIPR